MIPPGHQSFSQTLTGGNGRSTVTGQTFYYQLDVPAGRRELNAAIKLANNPNNPFSAFLVSPSGEATAFAANELPSSTGYTNEIGAQLHVLSPAPGRWTLIVAFIPQVSGTALQERFTVSTSHAPVRVSVRGLPDASGIQLAKGKAQTYPVRITNDRPAPEAYFIDARLPESAQLKLASLTKADTTVPLNINKTVPVYLIPTNTTAFTAAASTTGATPIEFDAQAPAGDPDVGSTVGSSVIVSLAANPIAQGPWDIAPDVRGAYGATGAPTEPVSTSMTATSSAFDPTVTSRTGDLWLASTNPNTVTSFSPRIVGPGQTATIPVTITPTGGKGTHVSGTLYVDDFSDLLFQTYTEPSGDQIAAIPYDYTVR